MKDVIPQLLCLCLALTLTACSSGGTFDCLSGATTSSSGAEVGLNDSDFDTGGIFDLAQSFELSTAREVNGVKVRLKNVNDEVLTSGTITVSVREGSVAPGTTDLASGTIDVSTISDDDDEDYSVEWDAVSLAADTNYWIVLSSDYTSNSTNHIQWMANSSDPYSDGFALYENPADSWKDTNLSGGTSHDFLFRVTCEEAED